VSPLIGLGLMGVTLAGVFGSSLLVARRM